MTLFGKNGVNKGVLRGVTVGDQAPTPSPGIILLTRAPSDRNNAWGGRGSGSGGAGGHLVAYRDPPEDTLIYTVFTKKCQKRSKKGVSQDTGDQTGRAVFTRLHPPKKTSARRVSGPVNLRGRPSFTHGVDHSTWRMSLKCVSPLSIQKGSTFSTSRGRYMVQVQNRSKTGNPFWTVFDTFW